MTRTRFARGVMIVCCALASACATGTSIEQIRELCAKQPELAPALRQQATMRIDSPQFSGDFVCVVVARAEPLAVRMQLFPDVGGKVLDVAATSTWQRGTIPLDDKTLDYPEQGEGDRLLSMFATSMLLAHSRIDPKRVSFARSVAGGQRMELAPRFGASSCVLTVDEDFRSRTFELKRRGVRWRLRILDSKRIQIEAKDFTIDAVIEETEPVDELPDDVFSVSLRRG